MASLWLPLFFFPLFFSLNHSLFILSFFIPESGRDKSCGVKLQPVKGMLTIDPKRQVPRACSV